MDNGLSLIRCREFGFVVLVRGMCRELTRASPLLFWSMATMVYRHISPD
jgi:hypothetical protein